MVRRIERIEKAIVDDLITATGGSFLVGSGGTFTAAGSATFEYSVLFKTSATFSGSLTVGKALVTSGTFTSISSATFSKNVVVKGSATFSGGISSRHYGGRGSLEHFIPAGVFQTGASNPNEMNDENYAGWHFTMANPYVTQSIIAYDRLPANIDVASGFDLYIYAVGETANATGGFMINAAPITDDDPAMSKGTCVVATYTGIVSTVANDMKKILIASADLVTAAGFAAGDIIKWTIVYDLGNATGAAGAVSSGITVLGLGIEPPTA